MLMDAAKMSAMIREKKKKLLESPEVVTNSPMPEMNAQDVEDMKQKGRIEDTLKTPPKINSDDAIMDMSESEANNVGVSEDEKKRMGRLRMMLDAMDI